MFAAKATAPIDANEAWFLVRESNEIANSIIDRQGETRRHATAARSSAPGRIICT
jgi:hypothetical protein